MKMKQVKRRVLMLSMILALGVLSAHAQDTYNYFDGSRGLFSKGQNAENGGEYGMKGSLTGIQGNSEEGLFNYGIGEPEAPLGSGVVMLVAASLGYAVLRKKEDEQ